nr:uncharacterized protein LOC105845425 isoform X2 [Hydra vulgaris]
MFFLFNYITFLLSLGQFAQTTALSNSCATPISTSCATPVSTSCATPVISTCATPVTSSAVTSIPSAPPSNGKFMNLECLRLIIEFFYSYLYNLFNTFVFCYLSKC